MSFDTQFVIWSQSLWDIPILKKYQHGLWKLQALKTEMMRYFSVFIRTRENSREKKYLRLCSIISWPPCSTPTFPFQKQENKLCFVQSKCLCCVLLKCKFIPQLRSAREQNEGDPPPCTENQDLSKRGFPDHTSAHSRAHYMLRGDVAHVLAKPS